MVTAMEIARIYNRNDASMTINIEPWGIDYIVPSGFKLSIHAEDGVGLVECIYENDGELSIYLNDCVFDDDNTNISHIAGF